MIQITPLTFSLTHQGPLDLFSFIHCHERHRLYPVEHNCCMDHSPFKICAEKKHRRVSTSQSARIIIHPPSPITTALIKLKADSKMDGFQVGPLLFTTSSYSSGSARYHSSSVDFQQKGWDPNSTSDGSQTHQRLPPFYFTYLFLNAKFANIIFK